VHSHGWQYTGMCKWYAILASGQTSWFASHGSARRRSGSRGRGRGAGGGVRGRGGAEHGVTHRRGCDMGTKMHSKHRNDKGGGSCPHPAIPPDRSASPRAATGVRRAGCSAIDVQADSIVTEDGKYSTLAWSTCSLLPHSVPSSGQRPRRRPSRPGPWRPRATGHERGAAGSSRGARAGR